MTKNFTGKLLGTIHVAAIKVSEKPLKYHGLLTFLKSLQR